MPSNNKNDKLKLPPISAMDEFLPTRTWQLEEQPEWKSPPYRDRNELSRDTSYKTCLYNTTSPILIQQRGIDPSESPQGATSSYFQYTTAIHSPTPPPPHTQPTRGPSRVDNDIEEVVRQCHTLCDNMVQRKSQFIRQTSPSELDSTRPWLDDMIGRANEVLNALLRLRKHQMASEQQHQQQQQSEQQNKHSPHLWRVRSSSPSARDNNNNHHVTRQRKRGKRPAFQGKCHSCNISETPEWRRGPDGARTLCNACGLHYAKLARKQQENRGMSTKRLTSSSPPPPPPPPPQVQSVADHILPTS
ncbi:hypothetical protein INT47_010224 [Mucor saturninus]|uniref:GATA-type domain-containing protein n=1 Tax=Mucor saturninus TaxID=64648 RepID=A0A8H7RF21_9FUNG|nr:hypothetical protein INT47_010224 [Mucor saturninus]